VEKGDETDADEAEEEKTGFGAGRRTIGKRPVF
jgi:hypothetical protein